MLKAKKKLPQKPLLEYLQEADINQIDLIDLALQYEDTMPLSEIFEILSKAARKSDMTTKL